MLDVAPLYSSIYTLLLFCRSSVASFPIRKQNSCFVKSEMIKRNKTELLTLVQTDFVRCYYLKTIYQVLVEGCRDLEKFEHNLRVASFVDRLSV
jgi:hypothetical protein